MSLLLIIVRVRLTSASTLSHEGGGREGYRAPKSVIDGDEVDGQLDDNLRVTLMQSRDANARFPAIPTFQGSKTNHHIGAYAGITDIQVGMRTLLHAHLPW